MESIQDIAIIGSGNVAWHLAQYLKESGKNIHSITSRNSVSGNQLAKLVDCPFYTILPAEPVDLILVCVNDDSIQSSINLLPENTKIAYTSGTKHLEELTLKHQQVGVFYPLQSFTKGKRIDIFEVPFFIEAKDSLFAQELFDLAWIMSHSVKFANSDVRKKLHLNAVFVNNFCNHVLYIAQKNCEQNDLDFNDLKPLLKETISKLDQLSAHEAQTGPARRHDNLTIHSQLEMLSGHEKTIYKTITDSILDTYKK